MLKEYFAKWPGKFNQRAEKLPFNLASLAAAGLLGLALCLTAPGCATKTPPPSVWPVSAPQAAGATNTTNSTSANASTNSVTLHEGDIVAVKFPGAVELDTVQTIRADGKITFAGAPDVKISGLTTDQAGKAILDAVGNQIKVKEISVTVQNQAFVLYITGSVGRPGRLVSDRPLTVLQAVLDAGVDAAKSNLKKVLIIRAEDGHYLYKTLDLDQIIKQKATAVDPFELKSNDNIYVPERFSWF
jgi:protein involved in polysaccharide export with SLBB domain